MWDSNNTSPSFPSARTDAHRVHPFVKRSTFNCTVCAHPQLAKTVMARSPVTGFSFTVSRPFFGASPPFRCYRLPYSTNVLKPVFQGSNSAFFSVSKASYEIPKTQSKEAKSPVEFVFDDPSDRSLFDLNSPSKLPVLLYFSGLGAECLPQCQASRIRSSYTIVSLGLNSEDESCWPTLLSAALSKITILRLNSPKPISIVAESFGAVFAFRLVAASPPGTFGHQVILNPATAVLQDSYLLFICSLLPLLRIDPTQRVLYELVASLVFNFVLSNPSRLDSASFLRNPPFYRGIAVDKIPLKSLLHRVRLLTMDKSLTDSFLRRKISIPTTLVASARDSLLQSSREVERLSRVLPNVQHKCILPNSAHTALFERDVDLLSILHSPLESDSSQPNKTISEFQWDDGRYHAASDLGKAVFKPWHRLVHPKVDGTDNVLDALQMSISFSDDSVHERKPIVFVGNHGCHGIMDTSLVFLELSSLLSGRKLRALAAPTHFDQYGTISGGRWTQFVTDLGAVQATPRNFCELLANGEAIVLFPGGGREVCRRRGEKNSIHWKERSDFVRIAAKYNAIIVPFSSVGADDAVDILIDGQELQQLPLIGPLIQSAMNENGLSNEHFAPLTSFPPRLDRFYFKFHEPLDTTHLNSKDRAECRKTFYWTKQKVETGINDLLSLRKRDPRRKLQSRAASQLAKQTRACPSVQFIAENLIFPFDL